MEEAQEMPDNVKLSAFVGSTHRDLRRARAAAIDAILHAGHIPNGMELWAAGHIPTQQAIKEQLNLCDLHLILLGSRYGSYVEGKISFTEWEYRTSRNDDRPVIAFILNDKEFEAGIKKGEVERPEKIRKLRKLRKKLKSNALCREFSVTRTSTLATDCVNAINQAINSGNLEEDAGWIRASSKRGKQIQAVERNVFLKRILERMHSFSTLSKRLEDETRAKTFLGRGFWELMLGRIKRTGHTNVFFESGSTLAFVSAAFEERVLAAEGDDTDWKITTNNALSLLQLLLHTHFDVKPRPAGAPEDYYGAMFDSALLRDPETAPTEPRSLFTGEKTAVRKTRDLLRPRDAGDVPQHYLYLAAASGLDFTHEEKAFRGPHVGSHPNMLFKRAIFETNEPIVLFLTSGKVGRPFIVGKCFPVFGPDAPWISACTRRKLALAIGYEAPQGKTGLRYVQTERERLLSELKRHGVLEHFDANYARRETESAGVIIVANDPFKSMMRRE